MGIIGLIKGFFIAVFVLMLMSAVPMFIMSNSIKATLLQPSFYQTQLESMNAYQKVQALLLDTFTGQIDASSLSVIGATKTELRTAMATTITKDWVKNESTRMINSLIWYMTDQTQGVNLSVSIKPKLTAGLAQLAASKLGISASDAEGIISQSVTSSIPDPFDLSTLMPGIKGSLKQAKSIVGMFMSLSGVVFIGIIVLLILIFLFTLDMVKFTKTVGIPMLIAGVLLAITSFLMPGTVASMLSPMMPSGGALTVQTAIDFLRPLFNDILVQSLILVVISVLLVAFSFAYPMIGNEGKKKK